MLSRKVQEAQAPLRGMIKKMWRDKIKGADHSRCQLKITEHKKDIGRFRGMMSTMYLDPRRGLKSDFSSSEDSDND